MDISRRRSQRRSADIFNFNQEVSPMATTADFRNGMVIRLDDGELYTIVEFQHVKIGRGGAFVRTKLKRVSDGSVFERSFRSGERIEEVRLEEKEAQYLYSDGSRYYFMDTDSFEQYELTKAQVSDVMRFVKEGSNARILFDGDRPVLVRPPTFVELQVVETEPGIRGDTVSGGSKTAKLETGLVIRVPLF
ncbi:TPA: elongation factor P, partial [Candidatus Poribacteria bacterium]|nr:elongation factor P [Candidatus Poribacteria bacterium]HEX28716.1 elongation factor P [Candidatus Poribacteria bacterium]